MVFKLFIFYKIVLCLLSFIIKLKKLYFQSHLLNHFSHSTSYAPTMSKATWKTEM